MKYVKDSDIAGNRLPGRLWKKLVDPETSECENMIFGLVTFEPGADPGPHVHAKEEEIIYVISGQGETNVEGTVYKLEPGVTVYNKPGEEHGVKNTGDAPLVMVCVFSPPVKPGSYDKNK